MAHSQEDPFQLSWKLYYYLITISVLSGLQVVLRPDGTPVVCILSWPRRVLFNDLCFVPLESVLTKLQMLYSSHVWVLCSFPSPKNCHDHPVGKRQCPENACSSRHRGCAVTALRPSSPSFSFVVVGPGYVALSKVLSAPFCQCCREFSRVINWLVVESWYNGWVWFCLMPFQRANVCLAVSV